MTSGRVQCKISGFENDGHQKKGIMTNYLGGKCVSSNLELRSGFFNHGFYRLGLFSTASEATLDLQYATK